MKKLDVRGDTIVEVLIAILVISSILAGAFVSVRRSQGSIRQSQERIEALNLAEDQIERVKALVQVSDSSPYSGAVTEVFCINRTTNTKSVLSQAPPTLNTDNFSVYGGCHAAPTGGVEYYFAIMRDNANTFIVRTRWDGVNGIGKQEVTLALRIDE